MLRWIGLILLFLSLLLSITLAVLMHRSRGHFERLSYWRGMDRYEIAWYEGEIRLMHEAPLTLAHPSMNRSRTSFSFILPYFAPLTRPADKQWSFDEPPLGPPPFATNSAILKFLWRTYPDGTLHRFTLRDIVVARGNSADFFNGGFPSGDKRPYQVILLPIWPLIFLFGALSLLLLPLARNLMPAYRRRLRVKRGLCAGCGYDLRATHDRCPECGLAITRSEGKN